jgi:hypothetical protein
MGITRTITWGDVEEYQGLRQASRKLMSRVTKTVPREGRNGRLGGIGNRLHPGAKTSNLSARGRPERSSPLWKRQEIQMVSWEASLMKSVEMESVENLT